MQKCELRNVTYDSATRTFLADVAIASNQYAPPRRPRSLSISITYATSDEATDVVAWSGPISDPAVKELPPAGTWKMVQVAIAQGTHKDPALPLIHDGMARIP